MDLKLSEAELVPVLPSPPAEPLLPLASAVLSAEEYPLHQPAWAPRAPGCLPASSLNSTDPLTDVSEGPKAASPPSQQTGVPVMHFRSQACRCSSSGGCTVEGRHDQPQASHPAHIKHAPVIFVRKGSGIFFFVVVGKKLKGFVLFYCCFVATPEGAQAELPGQCIQALPTTITLDPGI